MIKVLLILLMKLVISISLDILLINKIIENKYLIIWVNIFITIYFGSKIFNLSSKFRFH
jgi:hypothetical protein